MHWLIFCPDIATAAAIARRIITIHADEVDTRQNFNVGHINDRVEDSIFVTRECVVGLHALRGSGKIISTLRCRTTKT
ncbi:hypothetical protein AGR7A_Lc120595 [Agrobacterium deltaense NCPPB 1641]|uniref:Uncharacterized protein n=1 Tax=Agrobacterium deltaense NCPPB 1641 TaxID=1183425 RepID=A0A1S7TY97_9HYPH|nr:hypothetical protein AGR7A_Lc120595 [Agrobacterium deltaense NCPPB 1641]